MDIDKIVENALHKINKLRKEIYKTGEINQEFEDENIKISINNKNVIL